MTAQANAEISFEVYARQGERWLIEGIFPEQDEALELAKELSERSSLQGVKVLREIYFPDRGEALERVIFDTGIAWTAPPAPQPQAEPAPRARPVEPDPAPRRLVRPQPKPFPWLAATCSGVGLIAAVGLLVAVF